MKVKVYMYYLLILGVKCLIQQKTYTKTTRDVELFISLFAQKENHACQDDGQAVLLPNRSEYVHEAVEARNEMKSRRSCRKKSRRKEKMMCNGSTWHRQCVKGKRVISSMMILESCCFCWWCWWESWDQVPRQESIHCWTNEQVAYKIWTWREYDKYTVCPSHHLREKNSVLFYQKIQSGIQI